MTFTLTSFLEGHGTLPGKIAYNMHSSTLLHTEPISLGLLAIRIHMEHSALSFCW